MSARYFIAIGSNLGDRAGTIAAAIAAIDRIPGVRVHARSSLWETTPMGPGSGPFLNAVVEVRGEATPERLLGELLAIERAHGRIRRERWGDRTLDLDLLCGFDESGEIVRTGELTLPHPGVLVRDFVLVPLLEIDPELSVGGARGDEALQQVRERTVIGRFGRSPDE